jgi:hypothetical protein
VNDYKLIDSPCGKLQNEINHGVRRIPTHYLCRTTSVGKKFNLITKERLEQIIVNIVPTFPLQKTSI